MKTFLFDIVKGMKTQIRNSENYDTGLLYIIREF